MIAGLFALFGLFAVGKVTGKPAPDMKDVKDGDSDSADQQQSENQHRFVLLQPAVLRSSADAGRHAGAALMKCMVQSVVIGRDAMEFFMLSHLALRRFQQ
jgi:hypothetical protein